MKAKFSRKFDKQYAKSPSKVKLVFDRRLKLFLDNKFHSLLNNHSLTGKYQNHRSINITGNWRAIFKELNSGKIIYFEALGTHSQLYK